VYLTDVAIRVVRKSARVRCPGHAWSRRAMPRRPISVFTRAWLAMPPESETKGTRAPTAGRAVRHGTPKRAALASWATTENVQRSSMMTTTQRVADGTARRDAARHDATSLVEANPHDLAVGPPVDHLDSWPRRSNSLRTAAIDAPFHLHPLG